MQSFWCQRKFMRPIRRLLLFASEFGVLLIGFIFSLIILVSVSDLLWPSVAVFAFFSALCLTLAGLLAFRRKTRRWKIEFDAAGWARSRNLSSLYPRRAKLKRLARRTLVWLPCVIAAVALFFPVASHFVHPGSQYLRRYVIPIPWTFTVFSPLRFTDGTPVVVIASISGVGRFGVTPFWGDRHVFSCMAFWSSDRSYSDFPGRPGGFRREFQLNSTLLTCWQYTPPKREDFQSWLFGTGPHREVTCQTSLDLQYPAFHASFYGREDDLAAFYSVLAAVRPVN